MINVVSSSLVGGSLFEDDEYFFNLVLQEFNIPLKSIKLCYSLEDIEANEKDFVVALGADNSKAVGKKKISDTTETSYKGMRVYTSYDFNAIHINAKFKSHFKQVFKTIAFNLGYIKGFNIKPKIHLIKTKAGLIDLLGKLEIAYRNNKYSTMAVDLETTTFEYWHSETRIMTIGICFDDEECFAIPLVHPQSPFRSQTETIFKHLKKYLENMNCNGDNAKYDQKWIKAKYGINVNFTSDGILIHYAIDENTRHGLKYRAHEYCNAPKYDNISWPKYDLKTDDMSKVVSKYYQIDLDNLLKYQALDAFYSRHTYLISREILKKNPRMARIYKNLLIKASSIYSEIEMNGVFISRERLLERKEIIQKKIEELKERMNRFIPEGWEERNLTKAQLKKGGFNWNSPKQLGKLFFQEDGLNLPVIEVTAKGAPSTAETTLIELDEMTGHEVFKDLTEYRTYAKYLSTYIETWLAYQDENQRFHAIYKLHGTVTGRLSGDFQQVPRDPLIRTVIGAPEGWKFFEIDGSQIELRVASIVADERNMQRAYLNGEDIHRKTAASTTGKLLEDVTKDERKKAKATNFGYLYGMWWKKYKQYAKEKYGVILTDKEAQEARERFFQTYPDLVTWHKKTKALVAKTGFVVSPIGRYRRLPDIWSSDNMKRQAAEREAINSPVQGFASDFVLSALIWIYENLNKEYPDWRESLKILGGVHDSLFFEMRDDMVDFWIPKIKGWYEDKKRFKIWFNYDLPVEIPGDCAIGQYYGELEEL